MRPYTLLAGLAAATLLTACSPTTSDADEKAMRAEPRAIAEKAVEKELPVLDAQGNELPPELADAVREKMAEDKAATQSDGDTAADAPTDTGAPASNDET